MAFSGKVNDPDSFLAPVTESSKDLNPGLKGRDTWLTRAELDVVKSIAPDTESQHRPLSLKDL